MARSTTSALTVPTSVSTRPGAMDSTLVCSKIDTPLASTTRASPRTSRDGWMAAQWGVKTPPSTGVAASIALASSGSSSRWSSSVNPRAWAVRTSSRRRSSCTWVLARVTLPPRW